MKRKELPAPAQATPPEPTLTLPKKWFSKPLWSAIVAVLRPATALTRRKEITVAMDIPRQIFDDLMRGVREGDVDGLARDVMKQSLLPTQTTATLNHFSYTIRKGSVSERLFQMEQQDPQPPPPKKNKTALEPPAQIGEMDVYEVRTLHGSRLVGGERQYLVSWEGYASSHDSWEPASAINQDLVKGFHGKAVARPMRAPLLPHRGKGCARAFLSGAEQRRGAVCQMISMVCGNVVIHYKERLDGQSMGRLKLTFFVLTMDRTGHITWPTNFSAKTQAQLRNQARAHLRHMIDDPMCPVDATMEPAMVGNGTSSIWQGAPRRQLVIVQPALQ